MICRKSSINPGTRYHSIGLNDLGGVGNEAECELIIYNNKIENDLNKNNDVNENSKNENNENEKNYLNDENKNNNSNNNNNNDIYSNYYEKNDIRNYYCTYLFVRGTVPIKMKTKIKSIFDKPKIIMFYLFQFLFFIFFLIKINIFIKINIYLYNLYNLYI
jgi:hypothetical protein